MVVVMLVIVVAVMLLAIDIDWNLATPLVAIYVSLVLQ